MKRLNKLSKNFAKDLPLAAYENDSSDGEDQYDFDCDYFRKNILTKIRTEVTPEDGGEPVYEYWGGASSQRFIDVYAFYRSFCGQIPLLNNVICQVLGHRTASTTAESIFSLGGYCLNKLRTALLPTRAEEFILSASAYKMQEGMNDLVVPNIPDIGVISAEEKVDYLIADPVDLTAPINSDNLLNMDFVDDEDEEDYVEDAAELEAD